VLATVSIKCLSANGKEKVAGLPEHFTYVGQTSCTYPAKTKTKQNVYFFFSFFFRWILFRCCSFHQTQPSKPQILLYFLSWFFSVSGCNIIIITNIQQMLLKTRIRWVSKVIKAHDHSNKHHPWATNC